MTADKALLDRGMFYRMEGDGIPQVGLGIHVDGADSGYALEPPALGADTEAVLSELIGLSSAQIALLKAEAVI